MRRRYALPVVLMALLACAGCSSSTALAGEKFYVQSGVGRAFLPRDIAAVNAAVEATLTEDLGYRITSREVTGESAVFTARGSTTRIYKVQTWSLGPDETKLQISMGVRSGDAIIRNVMSKIEARLR